MNGGLDLCENSLKSYVFGVVGCENHDDFIHGHFFHVPQLSQTEIYVGWSSEKAKRTLVRNTEHQTMAFCT